MPSQRIWYSRVLPSSLLPAYLLIEFLQLGTSGGARKTTPPLPAPMAVSKLRLEADNKQTLSYPTPLVGGVSSCHKEAAQDPAVTVRHLECLNHLF
jgi:hypothetical protein